jgi:hypothetical protein
LRAAWRAVVSLSASKAVRCCLFQGFGFGGGKPLAIADTPAGASDQFVSRFAEPLYFRRSAVDLFL